MIKKLANVLIKFRLLQIFNIGSNTNDPKMKSTVNIPNL